MLNIGGVARHGSLQLDKEKVQLRVTDQGAHLPVFMHLYEAQTGGTVKTTGNNAE